MTRKLKVDALRAVIDVDVTFAALARNRRADGPVIILLLIDKDLSKVVLVLLELLLMTKHSVM